jgi:hypothetical protein
MPLVVPPGSMPINRRSRLGRGSGFRRACSPLSPNLPEVRVVPTVTRPRRTFPRRMPVACASGSTGASSHWKSSTGLACDPLATADLAASRGRATRANRADRPTPPALRLRTRRTRRRRHNAPSRRVVTVPPRATIRRSAEGGGEGNLVVLPSIRLKGAAVRAVGEFPACCYSKGLKPDANG